MFARWLAAALSLLAGAPSAEAHGIAGNRYFPGTLTFDDPAVADELILPNFSSLAHANGNGNVVDNIFAGAFSLARFGCQRCAKRDVTGHIIVADGSYRTV